MLVFLDLGRCVSIPNEMPHGLVVEKNQRGADFEHPVGGMVGCEPSLCWKSNYQMNIICKSPTEKLTEQFWDVNPWDGKMSVLCGLGDAQPGQGRGKWNISTVSAQVLGENKTGLILQPSSSKLITVANWMFCSSLKKAFTSLSFQCRTYCPSPETIWNQTTMESVVLPLQVRTLIRSSLSLSSPAEAVPKAHFHLQKPYQKPNVSLPNATAVGYL